MSAGFIGGSLGNAEEDERSDMRVLRVLGVMVCATLAVSAVGCANLTESFKPTPKVVTIEATVASVDATMSGVPLAEGRPENLPLWPGSKVETSTQTRTPQGRSWSATFITADDFDAVVKGLAVGLKDAGWAAEATDASAGAERTALLSASDDAAEALLTVTHSAESSDTSIDIVVTPKQ